MMKIGEKSDRKRVEIARGEEVEITLPENPTAGYRWRLDASDGAVCSVVEDAFEAPDPQKPGAGGTHHWRFRGEHTGEVTILLTLSRTWDSRGPGVQSFRVAVRVT
jgi:inhibitor of cysteine peptidase